MVGKSLEVNTILFNCLHQAIDVWSDIFETSLEFIKNSYNMDSSGNISGMKKDLQ
jgi:hypothetical protein